MVSAQRLIIVFLYLFLTFSVASAARSSAIYCFSCVVCTLHVAISFQWFAVYSFPRFFLAFKRFLTFAMLSTVGIACCPPSS